MASWLTVEDTPGTVLFQFITVEGVPKHIRREFQVVERPGIDNVGHVRKGLKGPEFTIKTYADVATVAAGQALQLLYSALEGTKVDLFYQDIKWSTVFVYAAEPQTVKNGFGAAGGLVGGPCLAPTVWTMRGIA